MRSQATAQTARQLLSALRHKHGGSDIIIVAMTITPFAGAQYQRGHGPFKGLFCSAIPLLKGPVLRDGVRMASDVLRGKTMKQALKNRVAPLVGDLVQAATPRPARKHATPSRRWPANRRAPSQGCTRKRPSQGDIFAWKRRRAHRPGPHSHAGRSCRISLPT